MESRVNRIRDQFPMLLIATGIVFIIMWVAVSAYRVIESAESLLRQRETAESMLATNITEADAEQIRALITATKNDIDSIDSVLSPVAPLISKLGWIPRIGPLLKELPDLLDMAVAGGNLADHGYTGLEPLLLEIQKPSEDGQSVGRIVQALAGSSEDFHSARLAYNHLAAARSEIDRPEELPWRIRTIIDQLDEVMPLLKDGLILGQAAPSILGVNGRRTFLILAQNEDELRANGGFISGAGIVSLDHGDLVSIEFEDANLIGDVFTKNYNWPPPPYREFMGLEYFLFRDANFWPDFPTSAEQAMTLYAYDRGTRTDGVIAIDQEFLKLLLSEIGPVNVPALEVDINSDNVVSLMREQWGPQSDDESWISQRNDFMKPLANAIIAKLTGNLRGIEPLGLARMIYRAASEKHLQVYVRDLEAAQLLEEAGWTGRNYYHGIQDYLNVVDMNVGYNKASAIVDRAVSYQVLLEEDGTGRADLTLQYTHLGQPQDGSCEHGPTPYSADFQYRDLVSQCYWDYLRIYTPKGTFASVSPRRNGQRLLLLTGWYEPGDNQIYYENSDTFQIYDDLFLLPTGQDLELRYEYRLPQVVEILENDKREYRLELKKQSGLISQGIQVTIKIPAGGNLTSTAPVADNVRGQEIEFSFDQRTDLEISIIYQLDDN